MAVAITSQLEGNMFFTTGQVVRYVGSQYPSLSGRIGRVIGKAGEADGPNAVDVKWEDKVICAVREWDIAPVEQKRHVS